MWNQDARFSTAKESFSRNGAKVWNSARNSIKTFNQILCCDYQVKKLNAFLKKI